MVFHLSATIICILIATSFVAGVIDAIAGGGGLIILPVFLSLGLPPDIALGTNRLQGATGELVASYHYFKAERLELGLLGKTMCFTMLGALLGTIVIHSMNPGLLNKLIPILLLVILSYSVLSGKLFKQTGRAKLSTAQFAIMMGLSIGFYNGFFGPATGSFWTAAFLCLLGFTSASAVMHSKPVNLIGNIVSCATFAYWGDVSWKIGLIMCAGQILGASLGAKLVLHKGSRIVTPLFRAVVLLMTLELIYRAFIH